MFSRPSFFSILKQKQFFTSPVNCRPPKNALGTTDLRHQSLRHLRRLSFPILYFTCLAVPVHCYSMAITDTMLRHLLGGDCPLLLDGHHWHRVKGLDHGGEWHELLQELGVAQKLARAVAVWLPGAVYCLLASQCK